MNNEPRLDRALLWKNPAERMIVVRNPWEGEHRCDLSQLPECRFKEILRELTKNWGDAEALAIADQDTDHPLLNKRRLSNWKSENTNSWPNPPEAVRLACRLGVSLDYLFTGEEPCIQVLFPPHIQRLVRLAHDAGDEIVEHAADYLEFQLNKREKHEEAEGG